VTGRVSASENLEGERKTVNALFAGCKGYFLFKSPGQTKVKWVSDRL
jgi:hypothetical protein